ncbi:MAG: hypothetical protein ACYCU7_07800 [Acidimicrobiales bacterium]
MRAVVPQVDERMLAERHRLGLDRHDEMWDGVLHVVPPASSRHQQLEAQLLVALEPVVRRRGVTLEPLGVRVAPRGATLAVGDHELGLPKRAKSESALTTVRPCSRASASATLETSRIIPSGAVRWRNGGRVGWATRPRRISSFTALDRPRRRSRRRASMARAVSGSKSTVVLIQ